jgi:Ca2+-transporting ATPase
MAMLPEELPIILTVFLTLGAWRISRRQVLTRQLAAIESLGAATVLCTDKTGTLTMNRMSVTTLCERDRAVRLREDEPLSQEALMLLKAGAMASQQLAIDPMELAFQRAAAARGLTDFTAPVRVYGLTPGLLAVTHVRQTNVEGEYEVAAKGAPEAVASLCRLDHSTREQMLRQTTAMAAQGLRVLAIAAARHYGALPKAPTTFAFVFLGLAGLSDPVRETVPEAVAECRKAGVRVIMVTGDYPATALAIARQVGIDGDSAVTGEELAKLSDAELTLILANTNIFSRVMPEQKLRIVGALKAAGEIVAMTGDGVNDAPALKAAHIGIAMGGRGTDVAREAAALVLLDDAFESIVAAIRLGRRIFDNLRKAISYTVAVHVPIAGVALAPLIFGWPVVFSPVHIVFLELVIDPVCSIAFEAEPEETDIMSRPPRNPGALLFAGRQIVFSLMQGAIGLLAILATYHFVLVAGAAEGEARAVAFVAIVAANLAMIFSNRSRRGSWFEGFRRPNPVLWGIVVATTAMLSVVVYIPQAASLFQFNRPAGSFLVLALLPAATVAIASEATKLIRRYARSGKIRT